MRKLILFLTAALALSCTGGKDTLTVMSYNVRTSVKDDGTNSWENRKEATPVMLAEAKPDIFGVQEARLDQERYIADQCPDYVPFGVGRDDGADEGERASIFYNRNKLEMLDGGTWWLSETPDVPSVGWDAKYPRTATWALMRVLGTGKQFYFVNTHLDHKGAEARRNGLLMIVDKIRQMNPDIPLVLTGDFNVKPSDPCLFGLDQLMKSARKVAVKTTDANSCNDYKKPAAKTIDYIYFTGFSKATEYAVLDKEYAGKEFISDHYPILAKLVF